MFNDPYWFTRLLDRALLRVCGDRRDMVIAELVNFRTEGKKGGAWEHREGLVDGFTRRYGLHRLAYAKCHAILLAARQREQNIKHWPRSWKIKLILKENLNWGDLYDKIV